jgi:serine/threonine protein kinase
MSPEQLMGKAAGPASDIYASGVVFYEVLAGQVPFNSWQPVQRCTQAPPRVIARRPEIPGWLDRLIARALAPNPNDRYATVTAMIQETGSFVETAVPQPAAPSATIPDQPPVASQSLASLLKDDPADLRDVLGLMTESHTLRVSPSGQVEISAHGPTGERDTLMVASPKYTPPELLRGRAPSVPTARVQADLYALGFVLYEFLLGRSRFRSQFPNLDERGTGLGWMEWHSDPARKPKPAAEVVPGTPASLSQLLARMLEKDPTHRCATYEEALDVIQDLANRTRQTQQVAIPPANPDSPRNRNLNAALAAVGVAVILGCLIALAVHLLR